MLGAVAHDLGREGVREAGRAAVLQTAYELPSRSLVGDRRPELHAGDGDRLRVEEAQSGAAAAAERFARRGGAAAGPAERRHERGEQRAEAKREEHRSRVPETV